MCTTFDFYLNIRQLIRNVFSKRTFNSKIVCTICLCQLYIIQKATILEIDTLFSICSNAEERKENKMKTKKRKIKISNLNLLNGTQ